ncbi:MAG: DnaJ domain-containing protein [Dehalococcoidia bacterium]|nr:DnaJ domain-containing protein [Dehalococcoidia bacterium]
MAGKDYYNILGLNRNATDKEIKQAYRRLARKHHPDVNPGDKSTESRFKDITTAYEVLSDPEKRKKYDRFGENWQYAEQFAGQQGAPYGFPGKGTHFEFVDLSDFGDMGNLSDLFGGFTRGFGTSTRTRRPRRGQDIEYATEVTLEEAYHGSTRVVTDMTGNRLEVKIPPGVNDGSRIKVAGKGGPGPGGGPNGDLYLVVAVKPHHIFQRKDSDLHVEVSVPLTDAVLGGEVSVSSLKGKLALKIPPETQNGKVFRLAGQGMPRMGATTKGNLFAKVKVVMPQKLTERERELFRQLKEIQAQPQRGEK